MFEQLTPFVIVVVMLMVPLISMPMFYLRLMPKSCLLDGVINLNKNALLFIAQMNHVIQTYM